MGNAIAMLLVDVAINLCEPPQETLELQISFMHHGIVHSYSLLRCLQLLLDQARGTD